MSRLAQSGGGAQYSTWAQIFDSSGAKVGSEFNVAQSNTSEGETFTDTVGLANGDFLVAWTDMESDGNNKGVFAKRYTASGTLVQDKFQVNTYTALSQWKPRIAALPDGGYVVIWESWAQNGATQYGIYGQRYNAQNQKVGAEFQVKFDTQYWTNTEYTINISQSVNGRMSVVWTSQDGGNIGIFTKEFFLQAAGFAGSSNDDIFIGSSANETMDGGAGTDTVKRILDSLELKGLMIRVIFIKQILGNGICNSCIGNRAIMEFVHISFGNSV
jgi:hypothetical protein